MAIKSIASALVRCAISTTASTSFADDHLMSDKDIEKQRARDICLKKTTEIYGLVTLAPSNSRMKKIGKIHGYNIKFTVGKKKGENELSC